jgi:hypothetical protein
MYLRGKSSMAALAVAAIAANVAAVLKRLLIVVPSQTHGGMIQLQRGVYTPTWIEFGVVLGAVGMLSLMILIFGRVFPLVRTPVPAERENGPIPRDRLRAGATLLCALGAASLIAIGLSDSFRLWSGDEHDPRLPFAPAIFATGVILLFSSALVYEAFPLRRRAPVARVVRRAGQRRVSARAHLITARTLPTRRKS